MDPNPAIRKHYVRNYQKHVFSCNKKKRGDSGSERGAAIVDAGAAAVVEVLSVATEVGADAEGVAAAAAADEEVPPPGADPPPELLQEEHVRHLAARGGFGALHFDEGACWRLIVSVSVSGGAADLVVPLESDEMMLFEALHDLICSALVWKFGREIR